MPKDIDVLIVEDNTLLRDQLVATLASEGLAVRAASDGRDALRTMQCWRPKVMVTDIYMPEMEGLELIRLTRTMWADLKIIAMTGGSDVFGNYLPVAAMLGADAVLQKPFMRADLWRLVTRMVAHKEPAPALDT